jgi:hypothetical protein
VATADELFAAHSYYIRDAGRAAEIVTAARESGDEKKRPWKCCDSKYCNIMTPAACRCMDDVERCDDACELCQVSENDPSKRICMDYYWGYDQGPSCNKPGKGAGVSDGARRRSQW